MSRFLAVELDNDRIRADDRPLLWDGTFGTGSFSESDVAAYPTSGAAMRAAAVATNARPGCIVSAIAQGRKVA